MFFGRYPAGRALRFNLFARASQKGFLLQSLTQSLFSDQRRCADRYWELVYFALKAEGRSQ